MRMALVGNGPTAPKYAAEIDGCDYVVRINAFPIGEAGLCWHAWASDFFPAVVLEAHKLRMFRKRKPPQDIWLLGAGCENYKWANIDAGHRFESSNGEDRVLLHNAINARPSSGLVALLMALRHNPEELNLFGFDATADKHRSHWWGEGWNDERTAEVHDFGAEKELIQDWSQTATLAGLSFDTRPVWWR